MYKHMQLIAVVLVAVSIYASAQSSTAKDQPVALSLIESVQPVYPEDARQQRIQGVVSLHALIGIDGSIKQLTVLSGPTSLRQAALDAVHQWRYRPVLKNSKPVAVATTINVNFALTSPMGTPDAQSVEAGHGAPARTSATSARATSRLPQKSAVTAARREEYQPRTPPPAPVFALTLATSLAKGVSSHELADEVTERGIDFYFDDSDREYLRLLGANDELLEALRRARFVFVDYRVSHFDWKDEGTRDEADGREAEAKRPDDPVIHWLVGEVLEYEQKTSDAIPELRKAIALKPDLACAHMSLALTLLASGDKQNALDEAREAVSLMPNTVGPLITVAQVLFQSGDLQGSIAELREAVQAAPDYYASHYELAGALLQQKNTDEAIHEYREAIQLNPNSEYCHFGLGRALFQKADYDGAAFELREAIRLNPRATYAHSGLAGTLLRAGHYEEAAAEARTALLYDPKFDAAKQLLTGARRKLSETAGSVAASAPQGVAQTTEAAGLGGTTWSCQEVQTDSSPAVTLDYSITFLNSGIVRKDGHAWGQVGEPDATWQLNGSQITIWTPDSAADMIYAGNTDTNSITARIVAVYQNHGDFGSLGCQRQTPLPPPPPPPQPAAQAESSSNHPPYDDKCIRLGPGTLGAVSFTNICSEPIDLKWCYRQHGVGGDWHCTVTPKLFPNHTLASPPCYQCSYDGRAAAYLSSRNLLAELPSDQEVASWTGSGPPQSASNNSTNSGSSDGQRQWRFVNPPQNWDTLTFEIHGRNGDSTSDDFNDETPIRTITLKPGESWTEDCGGYFSLDIKWVLASSSDPQTDIYYASLVCYANNFVWNNNHNLRQYDFPRQ